MIRQSACWLLVTVLMLLVGCAAHDYEREGDAARLSGRYQDAVRDYQAALAADRTLAQRPAFTAKLREAKVHAAFERGQSWASQGDWERAIEPYLEALAIAPDFTPAQEGLATARRNAAIELHQRALEQADAGALEAAIELLRRAVAIDPSNQQAQDALRSALERRAQRQDEARGLYEQALALTEQRQWQEAKDTLDRAIQSDGNHLRARTLAHETNAQLERSEASLQSGRRLLEEKRPHEAIAALVEALVVWPGNAEAQAVLGDAQAQRERVTGLLEQAERERQARHWRDSLHALYAARDIAPHHPPIAEALDQVTRAAVADLTATGHTHIDVDELEDAEEAFREAMEYAPSDPAVRHGLAAVAQRRGELAERQGLWGAAMLWHQAADNHHADEQHRNRAEAAKTRLIEQTGSAVALRSDPALEGAIRNAVERAHSPFVHLIAADTQDDHGHAHYAATVELSALEVHQELVRSEQLQFAYTDYETVPNPAIPKLQAELEAAHDDVDHLRRQVDLLCDVCHGTGHINCHVCGGNRFIACDHCHGTRIIIVKDKRKKCDSCDGHGHVRHDCEQCGGTGKHGEESCSSCGGKGWHEHICSPCNGSGIVIIVGGNRPCKHCDGHGHHRCGTCSGNGWLICGRCRGAGRYSLIDLNDLRRAEYRVDQLRSDLARAPATVREPYTAYWPYTRHEHAKTGALQARLELRSAEGGTVLAQHPIAKSAKHRDYTVDNANPAVGLQEDRLQLPPNDQVRNELVTDAASETASHLIATVTTARRETLLSDARRQENQDEHEQALEARIAAALILRATDPQSAAAELESAKRMLVVMAAPAD